jgi:hypothetical protein
MTFKEFIIGFAICNWMALSAGVILLVYNAFFN